MLAAAFGTRRRRIAARGLVCLVAATALSCATGGAPGPTGGAPHPASTPISTLTYEQNTLRIPIRIEPSGQASFAEKPPLSGKIDLAPIVRAEGLAGKTVAAQAMLHYGRLYVVADDFRAVWEITPRPGSSIAGYRSIPVPRLTAAGRLKDARLSRYGPPSSSCVRLDHAGGVLFITPDGEARDACP
ncbi:MAG TPA: hypothetical protein VFQ07_07900 [Candidatus Polarisedimenticolia bacterium]|nr:hypothetical protein [Candidatus Polarisedimenticolia bacterium]